jgi:hypothetical protein
MKNQVETILTEQEVAEIRELAYAIANDLTDRVLFTHMGILNALMWRAAVDYGVNAKNMDLDNWKNLLLCSKDQNVNIMVAHKYLEDYLTSNWKGAFYNKNTLRTYRKLHIQWGLFWFDIDSRPKGAAWGAANGVEGQGTATPPVLERVDIPKILIFYQVFDQVRRDRINWKLRHSENVSSFECMPEHGGMMMVQFYNALFHVTSDFRGNCHGHGDVIIETLNYDGEIVEPTPVFKVIIWKWTRRKGLFRMVWERMLVKAGQIAQQAVSLTSKLVDEPLGSIVEVPY